MRFFLAGVHPSVLFEGPRPLASPFPIATMPQSETPRGTKGSTPGCAAAGGIFFSHLGIFGTIFAWATQPCRFIPALRHSALAVTSPARLHPLSGDTHKRDADFHHSCISQPVTPKFGSLPQQVPRSRRTDIYPKASCKIRSQFHF